MSSAANAASSQPVTGFRRVWRTLRQLFHECMAAVFALLALAWINYGVRAWTRDGVRWLVAASFSFAALFAFFALTSFRRSRTL
jgi:hypothetical protein